MINIGETNSKKHYFAIRIRNFENWLFGEIFLMKILAIFPILEFYVIFFCSYGPNIIDIDETSY